MIFHIIGRNRNRFTLFPFNTNYISRKIRIRRYAKKPQRFNWFTETDTFANFVSESNLHKLTGLPFSTASSRIHDECNYEDLSIDQSMDIF
jgi:hypothetical protein